jgi:hypothetical protein
MEETTMTELMLRLNKDDKTKLLESLMSGDLGIGEIVELEILDYRNRFTLGKFKAEIKEYIPASPLN